MTLHQSCQIGNVQVFYQAQNYRIWKKIIVHESNVA